MDKFYEIKLDNGVTIVGAFSCFDEAIDYTESLIGECEFGAKISEHETEQKYFNSLMIEELRCE